MRKSTILMVSILLCWYGSAHPQKIVTRDCEKELYTLHDKYKTHFIFCSYYFDKVQKLSGADTVIKNLLFYYRDSSDMAKIKRQDSTILQNLKTNLCSKNEDWIYAMTDWCKTSEKISILRSKVDFTLEGYMELLSEFENTRSIFTSYLTSSGRSIYSLSSDEMETIYFKSITTLSFLTDHEREQFYKKFLAWHFMD